MNDRRHIVRKLVCMVLALVMYQSASAQPAVLKEQGKTNRAMKKVSPQPARGKPEMVNVTLVIAQCSGQKITEKDLQECPKELRPWMKEHGRIELLGRPQIVVLNNSPGDASIGHEEGNTQHSLNVSVTPRIRTDGKLDIEVSVGRSKKVSAVDGTWTRDEFSAGRRITAVPGKTVVVSDLRTSADEEADDLVIALTPRPVAVAEDGLLGR